VNLTGWQVLHFRFESAEVIAVGTVWKVWHSTVHFAQFEVEEVLEVARGGETISPPSHGGNTWMVFC
jgi:hypothetical protein